MNLPCLSLWQPWADVIFRADDDGVPLKPDETRGWPTNVRGRIAIHAAKRPLRTILREHPQLKLSLSMCGIREHTLAFGAIVGTVDLIDCLPAHVAATKRRDWQLCWGDYRHIGDDGRSRYAFVFANPQRLPAPIPCVGRQGFFRAKV